MRIKTICKKKLFINYLLIFHLILIFKNLHFKGLRQVYLCIINCLLDLLVKKNLNQYNYQIQTFLIKMRQISIRNRIHHQNFRYKFCSHKILEFRHYIKIKLSRTLDQVPNKYLKCIHNRYPPCKILDHLLQQI